MPSNESNAAGSTPPDDRLEALKALLEASPVFREMADLQEWLQTFRALLDMKVRVDRLGRLVVPAGIPVQVPGKAGRENIQVSIDSDGVNFKVVPR
ncbi:hypothetical protein [Paracidovorax konjaci]|uniref:Uncharacterized protein n=1 Tax=Paracidovorax konjaci TaxID=32040 RepID=A0A1I1VRD1_9BURK|nr:hypothetical protein [Paracidovorax konjaci]SFD85511.1 hypothetical protein SAMN04489710_107103 [Paracidovorax konjaci]